MATTFAEGSAEVHTHISHDMTKPIKWVCAQRRFRSAWASAQSDLYSLCVQWVAKDPRFLHADSEDWSDWANAQADLSFRWAHRDSFCWFCHVAAQYYKLIGPDEELQTHQYINTAAYTSGQHWDETRWERSSKTNTVTLEQQKSTVEPRRYIIKPKPTSLNVFKPEPSLSLRTDPPACN